MRASVSTVYPTSTTVSVPLPATATSSSQMKNISPTTAGHSRTAPRQLRDVPAADAEPPERPGEDVVDRRERVDPLPDRREQRRQHRDPDPAVDPQEQRRDGRLRRAAGDALGDDPDPADQADDAQRRSAARPGRGRCDPAASARPACRARARTRTTSATVVAAPDEVDGERQRALVDGAEVVGRDDRRRAERDRERRPRRPPRARSTARPSPDDAVHADRATPRGSGAGRRPRRRRRSGARR